MRFWFLSFTLFALAGAFLVACTDYVDQIDGQIAEFNEHDNARTVSMRQSADYQVNPADVVEGTLVDERDGKNYRTVTIGSQTWMAENLDFKVPDSYCYNDMDTNCTMYGRLYTWAVAMDSVGRYSANGVGCGYDKLCAPAYPVKGVCPNGWHIPSYGDWQTLLAATIDVLEYTSSVRELFSKENWGTNVSGNDEYRFAAVPAGVRMNNGKYYYEGSRSAFWTSTEDAKKDAYAFKLGSSSWSALESNNKDESLSIRCVNDVLNEYSGITSSETPESSSSASFDGLWFLWDSSEDNNGMVETGFSDETGTSGFWYDYSDIEDGGTSAVLYPADVETNEWNSFFGPLVEKYGGIKGVATFGEGVEFPYARLAFNVVGEMRQGADVHEWGGLCLSYTSTASLSIEIVAEEDAFVTDDTVSFRSSVGKTPSIGLVDIPWERFRQPAYCKETKDIEGVLSRVAVIRLNFEGAAGDTVDFMIRAIGSLGKCPRIIE